VVLLSRIRNILAERVGTPSGRQNPVSSTGYKKQRHLLKSDVSGRKEQEQLAVYGSHYGSMTAGRPGVNTTHRYTSDDMAKRWWPRRPLCVASPRQPPSTRRGETDDRALSVLSACPTSKSRCSREGTEKLNCGSPSEGKTSPRVLERDEHETHCWSGLMKR
jgi:hypothetical protein